MARAQFHGSWSFCDAMKTDLCIYIWCCYVTCTLLPTNHITIK